MTDCFGGFPPHEMTLLMGAYFLDLSISTEEMGGKRNGRIEKRKYEVWGWGWGLYSIIIFFFLHVYLNGSDLKIDLHVHNTGEQKQDCLICSQGWV